MKNAGYLGVRPVRFIPSERAGPSVARVIYGASPRQPSLHSLLVLLLHFVLFLLLEHPCVELVALLQVHQSLFLARSVRKRARAVMCALLNSVQRSRAVTAHSHGLAREVDARVLELLLEDVFPVKLVLQVALLVAAHPLPVQAVGRHRALTFAHLVT